MPRSFDLPTSKTWNEHASDFHTEDHPDGGVLWIADDKPSKHVDEPRFGPKADIKPYVQALTTLDLESCVRLEEATFPEHERCKREKFEYRFAVCGELSLGLFTSADTTLATSSHSAGDAPTAATAVPIYSGTPERKAVLLGQVIATKTTNPVVRDEDMEIPTSRDDMTQGHRENGRTLCIHSFAVLPDFHGQGLGKLLLRSYIQRMRSAGVADRIAIIVHEELIRFYEGFGFEIRGLSSVKFGGGGWMDMTLEFADDQESEDSSA